MKRFLLLTTGLRGTTTLGRRAFFTTTTGVLLPHPPHHSSHRTSNPNRHREGGSFGRSDAARGRPHSGGGGAHPTTKMSGPVKDRYPPLSTDLADPRRRLAILIDGSALPLFPSAAAAGSAEGAAESGSGAGVDYLEKLLLDSALYNTLLPAVAQVGVPVLIRLFYFQMLNEWAPFFTNNGTNNNMASSPSASHGDSEGGGGSRIETRQLSTNVAATALQLPRSAQQGGNSSSAPKANNKNDNNNNMIQLEFFRVERFIPIAMQIEADAQHIYNYRNFNKIEGVCYVSHEVDRSIYERLMEKNVNPNNNSSSSNNNNNNRISNQHFFNQFLFDELGLAREMANDGRQGDGSTMAPAA